MSLHAQYAATLARIDQGIAEHENQLSRAVQLDEQAEIKAKLGQLRELREVIERRLTEPDQDFPGQQEVEITCPHCGKVTRLHTRDGKKPPDVACFKCWREMGSPE